MKSFKRDHNIPPLNLLDDVELVKCQLIKLLQIKSFIEEMQKNSNFVMNN